MEWVHMWSLEVKHYPLEREFSGPNLKDITHNKFSILSKIAVKPNTATNMCIVDGFLTL